MKHDVLGWVLWGAFGREHAVDTRETVGLRRCDLWAGTSDEMIRWVIGSGRARWGI